MADPPAPASFVTETEAAFAQLLDILEVRWEYEPHEFVLEESAEGRTKTAFRPDFYLPEHGLFIEVTAAKSLYRKRRKIRQLREISPETRVALVCFRDRDKTRKHLRVVFQESEDSHGL